MTAEAFAFANADCPCSNFAVPYLPRAMELEDSCIWQAFPAQCGARSESAPSAREAFDVGHISADCTIAVIKIGGSILKNARAFRRAARFVRNRHIASPDERLVVVVSAQEGVTDRLAATARQIVSQPNPPRSICCGPPANCARLRFSSCTCKPLEFPPPR